MKRVLSTIALAGLLSAPGITASAQVAQLPTDLVAEYMRNDNSYLSLTWWNALSADLTLRTEGDAENIDPKTLQNIIYFASQASARLDLSRAVPGLIRVFRSHPDQAYRMMALAALSAIGDKRGLAEIRDSFEGEQSRTIRNMSVAVLREHRQARD
ncbi:MAG: hypothetical protein ACI9W4_001273 [Rhodothermales bacterium]|jgi:hypothetical protein